MGETGIIDTSKWLTPKEVAELLRYSTTDAVLDACRNGTLRAMKRADKNGSYLIDPESVAEWQRERITGGKKKEQSPAESPLPPGIKRFV